MKKLSLVLVLALFGISSMLAQRTVTGVVSDNGGEPLIGVSVFARGTNVGTVTDIDGSYSLKIPEGANTLIFSYTGFKTVEVPLGASNVIDCTLAEGLVLDEVVVTAVGLESNKRTIGYAIQNVEPDDVLAAKETNFVNALNSKVAGVNVISSSGSPGASANIRIRGSVSINGTNSPLFVVDGVPIDNSQSYNNDDSVGDVDNSNRAIDINPNDIASITVLKGPSATALYGVRAANGAIIVTTKKGAAGKPKVNISSSYGIDKVNKLPDRQDIYAQGSPTDGVPVWKGPHTGHGFSWGPLISDLEFDGSEYDFDQGGQLVPKGQGNGVAARAYDPYDFFVTGQTYDLNASVSGGNDAIRYYISGGRLSQQGIVPNADFDRNSFRVNVDANLTDRLSATMAANYVTSGGSRIQRGSNIKGVMLGLLRTTPTFDNGNGKTGQDAADDVDTYVRPDGNQRSYRAGIYDNPFWTVNKNPSSDNVNRVIGHAGLSYDLLDGLTLAYKLGVDRFTDRRNSALDINPGRDAGSVNQSMIDNINLNSDLLLSFNRNLSQDLGFSATIGHNYFNYKFVRQGTNGTTLAAPDFYHISNASDLQSFETINRKRLQGAFGTFDFNYADYLFLNLTARNDWSSILPAGDNTFQSYSASLGFALTELPNMTKNDILPYAKLRASYGVVGNDGGTAFIYSTSNYFNQAQNGGDGFITTIDFPAFGFNAYERSAVLGNDKLRPEKTTTWEVGGEFKFLRGRVGLDLTYFDSKSEDVIIAVQLPASTGFTNSVQNAAVITNKGWEALLNLGVVSTNDFSWDIDVNYTAIENKVEELAEGIEDIGLNGFVSTSADVVPGEPFSVIYGNGFQRDDNGNVLIGADGWPLQDPTKKALGDPNPDFTAGIRNTFNFKGVSLSALFDTRQGGDMWCGTCGIINYFGTSQQSADERNDVVVFEGVLADGTPNNIPVALANPADGLGSYYRVRYGFGGISEMNIYDASWIRLREVTLGYSLPSSTLDGTFIEGVRLSLTGRNLWLDTDYPGIDPETNLTGSSNGYGLDYFNMPNTKSFVATLNLTF